MSENISRAEVARILGLAPKAITKLGTADVLPYVYDWRDRRTYPRSFVKGLATANNGLPFSRNFARLFLIAWQRDTGVISRQESLAKIRRLRQERVVLTDLETARLVGYNSSTISAWRTRGWVRSVRIGRWKLSLRQEIERLKALLDQPTEYEMASMLGINHDAVRYRIRTGQLNVVETPSGSLRADTAEIQALAAHQAKVTTNTMSAKAVADVLGVPVNSIFYWTSRGVLNPTSTWPRRIYRTDEIMVIAQRFQTITPGFEWLSTLSVGSGQPDQLWCMGQTAGHLEVPISQLHSWSKQALVPFYVRTPEGLAAVQRQYVKAYIVGLKAHAGSNKITKAVVQRYYFACQGRGFIVSARGPQAYTTGLAKQA